MDIPREIYLQVVREFSDTGIHQKDLYLLLYLITIKREGFTFKVITERSPISNDIALFEEHENKLDLYYENTRFVLCNVSDEKKILFKVNEVFNRLIFKDQSIIKHLGSNLSNNWFEQFDQYLGGNHFGEIFDVFLEIIVGAQNKKFGEFVLPTEIGGFLLNLADLENNANIFNPFAGLATFGIDLRENQTYLGHEIDELIWAVAILRLNAHNRIKQSDFLNADSFGNWPSSRKFDLVIANAPFKLPLSKNQQTVFSGERLVEGFFLNEGIKLLKPKGKLITIVPQGFLSNHSDKKTRQFLVEQDLLEAVITFPGGLLMHTSIPFVVLLINKKKSRKNEIAFIQGSKYVTNLNRYDKIFKSKSLLEEIRASLLPQVSRINEPSSANIPEGTLLPELISKDIITKNDFYLDIKRYWLDKIKGTVLREVINIEETFSFKQAVEYVENKDRVGYIEQVSFMEFKHVSSKNLKIEPKDYFIDVESIEYKRVSHGKFIKRDTYLVSLIGSNLKPSFLPTNDSIIHLSNDVLPFSINEKLVDPHWLIRELSTTKVKEQMEVLVTGVIPRLRREDFLNLKINIPSKKEQIQEIQKIKGLEMQVDSLESDIIQQNSYLRHTVAGPLSDLDHALKAIDSILKNISKNEMPNILSAKISDNHLYTLGEHIDDSKKHVAIILDTIANKLNSSQSIEQKKLEKLNLLKHIEKYVNRKNENTLALGYYIEFDFDKDFFNSNPNAHFEFISGNKNLVNTLLDNMIDNAVKHAFTEGKKNKIEVYVWGYDEDAANKRIFFTIANTGTPLPKNITLNDLKKRGYSSGGGQGDGFGLYLVNEIVRKHKADWFLVDDYGVDNLPNKEYVTTSGINYSIPKDDCVTKFSFSFPIFEE